MAREILYHVAVYHGERTFIGTFKAKEDPDTWTAYHLDQGRHMVPDYAAIREALPHYWRKAYDRAGGFWFPATLHSPLSGLMDPSNAAHMNLLGSRGKHLGTLYATPYLYQRDGQ